MNDDKKIYSEHIKYPQVRVIAYQLPNGEGFVAEAINAGAIGHGSTLEQAWEVFEESLEGLYELSIEDDTPMTFEPRSEDNELFLSFAETGPRLLEDGRKLWFAILLNRNVKPSAAPSKS